MIPAEGLGGFVWYLIAAALVISISLALWYAALYFGRPEVVASGAIADFVSWIGGHVEGATVPLALVITTSVSLAGSFAAIKLSNSALRLSKISAKQQNDQIQIERHQKAIEVCNVISPVVADAERTARELTERLLTSHAQATLIASEALRLIESKFGAKQETDHEDYDYIMVSYNDLIDYLHETNLSARAAQIVSNLSSSVFAFAQSFQDGKSHSEISPWSPYNRTLDKFFEKEMDNFRASKSDIWSEEIVLGLDHRKTVSKVLKSVNALNIFEVAALLSAQSGRITENLIVNALIGAFADTIPENTAEKDVQIIFRRRSAYLNQDNLSFLFFTALLKLDENTANYGYVIPDTDEKDLIDEQVKFCTNAGILVLEKLVNWLPSSEDVEKSFTTLIVEMTKRFESGSTTTDETLSTYVGNFLRVYTVKHDGNRTALGSFMKRLVEIRTDPQFVDRAVFIVRSA